MRYLFLIPFIVMMSCSKKPAHPPPRSFPVNIGTAIQKNSPIFVEALGHIEPIVTIAIRSRIEGELTGIFFKQGDEVKKGDLLFTIDPKLYQADLKKAKGLLEETLANLALAEEKVKRYRKLTQEEYYSQLDYETLQANVASLKAQQEQYEGEVARALVNLDYCWITAPIEGKTGVLQVDYGNLVTQNDQTPLVTLNQISPIFVAFFIPENQLYKVRCYQKKGSLQVLASFENFETCPFMGTLYMIDNEVDDKTGMIQLRASFDNESKDLWPGQFIRVRLVLETLADAIQIPYKAVQLTPTGPIVFVVKSDMTVEKRQVKLGQREGENILVLSGIQADEKVVLEGQLNLKEGVKVFIPKAKQ